MDNFKITKEVEVNAEPPLKNVSISVTASVVNSDIKITIMEKSTIRSRSHWASIVLTEEEQTSLINAILQSRKS